MSESQSDQELLLEYCERGSESAFAELVRRHVDHVYSAARRMTFDSSLAEDVTQKVFVTLAQNAAKLSEHPTLCGWLHRTVRNIAHNARRSEVRRRAREEELAQQIRSEPEAEWHKVAPHIDEALAQLPDKDREVLLLRFFHGKSAQAIAETLNISHDAAQKRATRALERLRGHFADCGTNLSASAWAALIAANAVHSAPVGIAASIPTILLQGAAVGSSGVLAGNVLTMTFMQKAAVAVSLASVAGLGFLGAQRSQARQEEIARTTSRVDALAAQVNEARAERDWITSLAGSEQTESQRLKNLSDEASRLRELIGRLSAAQQSPPSASDPLPDDAQFAALRARVETLKSLTTNLPALSIPEIQLLRNDDWIEIARETIKQEEPGLSEETRARIFLREVRGTAKRKLGSSMMRALFAYAKANDGSLPGNVAELEPYFAEPIAQEMLARYEVVARGKLEEQPPGKTTISEKGVVDAEFDTQLVFTGNDAYRLLDMAEFNALKNLRNRE